MPSSGVTAYSVTENDVITDAYQSAGIYGPYDVISAEDIVLARRKLNFIIKQWTSQADFAPGLKMWTRRRGFIFLRSGQVAYNLGPTGDNVADSSYVTTTLTAAASLGASTITVASITGLASGMFIGILLSTGDFQWTTINGAPSGSTITLTATLTAAAANGARVFAYTSKIRRPFELQTAVLRDTDNNDTPMDPALSVDEYEAIPSKTSTGTPSSIYFEAQRTNAVAYINVAPDDRTKVIRIVYLSYVEDSTGITDDIDFPSEWYRALSAQLTIDVCTAFQKEITATMKVVRDEALAIARNVHPANSRLSYQTDPDEY